MPVKAPVHPRQPSCISESALQEIHKLQMKPIVFAIFAEQFNVLWRKSINSHIGLFSIRTSYDLRRDMGPTPHQSPKPKGKCLIIFSISIDLHLHALL